MEQIKFYLDEHIHSAVAEGLRHRGVNVLTVQEAGRSGFSDREQLAFALTDQRVMVTMDSDFLTYKRGPRSPGVIEGKTEGLKNFRS